MNAVSALIRRDLVLAYRQGGGLGSALGFFLAVVALMPLGLGPDQALLQRIAPGALWIALLLAVLLSADLIFRSDFDDGSLDLMAMSPMPLEGIVLIKAVVHWLTASLPLAIAAPCMGLLLNMKPGQFTAIGLAMLAGSLNLSLLAAFGAAVTVGLRRGGLLASLLLLPIYVPVLIFGIAASRASDTLPDIRGSALLILAALSLAALVVVPIASAAALRSYLR
ncbi:MAG: heme exporter protein CcmB [Pseudomonadota bacterium]|nr:heme exporter protein CcmB [Pseudomonadota bacterium]